MPQTMPSDDVLAILEDRNHASAWLRRLGVTNSAVSQRQLVSIAKAGVPIDLMGVLCSQLQDDLPSITNADIAVANLSQIVTASRSPLAFVSLLERDRRTLPTLLRIIASSQRLADLLIQDPESFDLLRLTEGQPVAREVLVKELLAEVQPVALADADVKAVLRRVRDRETLRIAYGDLVQGLPADTIARQNTYVADAIVSAALSAEWQKLAAARGTPLQVDGSPSRLSVIGLGRLGGVEIDYDDSLRLLFVYDVDGKTDGSRSTSNREFYDRVARGAIEILTDDEFGPSYDVEVERGPLSSESVMVASASEALHHYDVAGRTSERMALVKARSVAGDAAFGKSFLRQLEPWIYRRYLSAAEIAETKALKRRIERRHGGAPHSPDQDIAGIEFVIQFLQLLNGSDLEDVRATNTLDAIAALTSASCLTMQEQAILESNYETLRAARQRTQITADNREASHDSAQASLEMSDDCRKVLSHLMQDTFEDDERVAPETEIVLDPEPSPQSIAEVLGGCGFRDVNAAYRDLLSLANEPIPFLSTRRCRHFLASIAPKLLTAIASSPNPQETLSSLARVSDSLGGKGVLWELFHANPPTLDLYVRLCAASPYLAGILTSNPGMIDELMDSLVLNKLPSLAPLTRALDDLCQRVDEIQLIVQSFKSVNHLRVGARDVLRKDDVTSSHRALSDIAEACLQKITQHELSRLTTRLGQPTCLDEKERETPCEFIILALGKLGGREPNYHSDLDVIFLYDADGKTKLVNDRGTTTSNQHFFGELGKRVMKAMNQRGPSGTLYELDRQVRPTGEHGPLAVSLCEFKRYFSEGDAATWELQALCKARPIFGSKAACKRTTAIVHEVIRNRSWHDDDVVEIRERRFALESSASPLNLKRGFGGTVDIEFSVQMLQLKHASQSPEILQPGTVDAIAALRSANIISDDDHDFMAASYRFLRSVEAGLRLMDTSARHDLPTDEGELRKLAYLLRLPSGTDVAEECRRYTRENRERFSRLFG